MGLRFRRRVGLGRGAWLNVSKSGVSVSAGGRGFGVNVGRRGLRTRAGIPGTGISWVSGGRRSGDSAIGGLIVLAVLFWIISAIATILIVAGAVALVVGLGLFIARHVRSSRESAQLAVAHPGEAPQAAKPESTYHAVVPIDPAVFREPQKTELAALTVFKAWARQLPNAPRDPTDSVRGLRLRSRLVGRLLTDCVGRHVVWRSQPYRGRARQAEPPVRPEAVDPWTADVAKLQEESRHYAACETCRGKAKVDCSSCGGTGRVGCVDCGGQGKVYGVTASGQQRLLNCKSCRGRGDVACRDCSRGRVTCPTCEGAKKLERWLDVKESERIDIQIEPDGDVTRAFHWGTDGVPASDEEVAADAAVRAIVEGAPTVASHAVAQQVPHEWMAMHWQAIQPRLQAGERIRSQRFSLLDLPAIEVTYSLDNELAQTVELEGLRLLAPPARMDQLFHQRAAKLRWIRSGLAIVPAVLAIVYLARGTYFQSGAVAGLIGCVVAACLATYGVFWTATLGRRGARYWLPAAILPAAGAAALAFIAEPDLATARELVQNGEYDGAVRELEALGAPADPDLAPIYADMRLRQVMEAPSWKDAKAIATDMPAGTEQHRRAWQRIDALVSAQIKAALAAAEYEKAKSLLAEASSSFRSGSEGIAVSKSITLGEGQACLRAEQWDCVFERAASTTSLGGASQGSALRSQALSALDTKANELTAQAEHERDRHARITLAQQAASLWALSAAQTGAAPNPQVVKLKTRLDADVAAQEKEEAKRRAAAEKERLREEKKRQREEERRARAERRAQRAYAPLRCVDGSFSPSCTCGGSWQGCCSHHGGVSGCSE